MSLSLPRKTLGQREGRVLFIQGGVTVVSVHEAKGAKEHYLTLCWLTHLRYSRHGQRLICSSNTACVKSNCSGVTVIQPSASAVTSVSG